MYSARAVCQSRGNHVCLEGVFGIGLAFIGIGSARGVDYRIRPRSQQDVANLRHLSQVGVRARHGQSVVFGSNHLNQGVSKESVRSCDGDFHVTASGF